MRRTLFLSSLLFGLLTGPGFAQTLPTIGVAAPLTGPSAVLGRQIAAGVGEAAGDRAEVIAADTACTAAGGEAAARELVSDGAEIVIGFLCTSEIEAALPILTEAGIPVLDVGVRANRLTDRRERTGHLVWRIAPRSDAEAEAIADFVRDTWRDQPFGLVEDGSVYARDLADEVRARLGPNSIEPSFVDNYRPAEEVQLALARRIARSGVTRLLVFGDRADVAILARDATELGLTLDLVGGESLLDVESEAAKLPEGIRAIAIDESAAGYPVEEGAVVREGYHGASFAAAEIALEAVRRTVAGVALPESFQGAPFATVLGPIGFAANGDSDRAAFTLLVWDGARFVPAPQT